MKIQRKAWVKRDGPIKVDNQEPRETTIFSTDLNQEPRKKNQVLQQVLMNNN